MGPSSELSLDLKPSFSLKMTPMAGFLRDVSTIGDGFQKLTKVEEYVACLEEERKKIDAFKRELPLCMLLLNDAIEVLKAEKKQCRSNDARPVLEEFIPIISKFNEEEGVKKEKEEFRDKMNWMSSAQLWSDNCADKNKKSLERVEESSRLAIGDPISESKYRNRGGAFMPFKGFSGFPTREGKEEKDVLVVPDLSLLSSSVKSVSTESGSTALCSKGSKSNAQSSLQARKARRCWSPELHRRFINALQQLGGAQVATPKQIRELMKVEGLTNDEVKSHLQKYRLHTRKLPSSTSTSSNQSLVLLRGIWGSDDHYESSKPSTSQSGSPQGPLQLAGTSRGISHTGGDSCEEEEEEEEEEEKSESFSWKGHRIRSGEYDTE